MPEIVKHCPLCDRPSSSLFDVRSFHGHQVRNAICNDCGLVYQTPRMTEVESQEFYQAEYRLLYQGEEGPSQKDLAVQQARARELAAFVAPFISKVSNHLDIGCSAGRLLTQFQDAFGCQAVGIEPGNAYRDYARAQGLVVYATLCDLSGTGAASFDLVSLAHVLEHIPDPVAYLANLRQKYMGEKGWLLLEVPALYGHECFEVAHLVSFSPHTVVQVVRKAGFEAVEMETHGMPRSLVIPLYITLLARAASNHSPGFQVVPEKQVRLKRKWGMLKRQIFTRLLPRKAWLPYPNMG